MPARFVQAFRTASLVEMYDLSSPRFLAIQAQALADYGTADTRERRTAHREKTSRRAELSAAKARQREEYDVTLFAEAAESMSKMADGLEGEVCHCELCASVCRCQVCTKE